MKWIRTLVLVVLALILGLWVFYGERNIDDKARRSRPDKRLVRVARDGIDTLTIITDIKSVKAVCYGDSLWRIIEPFEWRGDSRNWELVVQNLRTSMRERTFYANSDSLRFFSLKYPNATVIYTFRDKSMPAETLYVGSATPNDKLGYVRFSGTDSVITTNIAVHHSVLLSLPSFRYKWIFEDYDQDFVTSVRIRRGEDELRMTRDGNRWRMTHPVKRFADADTVARFLKAFTDQRVEQFYDNVEKSPEFFGLGASSRAEVELGALTESGEGRLHHLRIGTLVPSLSGYGYSGVFAMDEERQQAIMQLPIDLLYQIDRETTNYWDRRIAIFERRDIDSLSIAGANGKISLSRTEQGMWRMWSPNDQQAKRSRVNYVVADMDMARTAEFTNRPGTINNPRLKIELWGSDTLHAWISFGDFRGDKVYATGSATDELVLVDRSLYDKLNATVDEFNE